MNQDIKHAILFSPEGPGISAEGIVTAKFVKMLCNHGWTVLWIYHDTSINYGGDWKDDQCTQKAILNSRLLNLSLKLSKVPILKYIYLLDNIVWCIRAYRFGLSYARKHPINNIFSRIMPQYGHLPAMWLSKHTGITWIANWSDPMPHSKAPAPYGKGLDTKLSMVTKWYLRTICKEAAYHTFPSERLMDYYLNYLPAKREQCFVVPHIIDRDWESNTEEHRELRLYHIGGGLIHRNPRLFFRALHNVIGMEKFKNLKIDLKFVGPIESDIDAIAREENIGGMVKLVGKQPYDVAMHYISQSDMILVIEAPMEEGIFLPSKIADILSCHKPIFAVSPPKGVLNDLISSTGCGIATNCLDVTSIEEGLKKLFTEWLKGDISNKYDTQEAFELYTEKRAWEGCKTMFEY